MLDQQLRERILAEGPITFAQFMEHALYQSEHGFYAHPPIGPGRHYVTSPHVSECFADLLAAQLAECGEELGNMTVVEAGAGDGTLAGQILASRSWDPAGVRYIAVDRSAGAREASAARGIETVESLAGIRPFDGVVLANELLDNVPFHRLRMRSGRLVEIFVGVDGEEFVETEGEPSAEALEALGSAPEEGEERPSSPGWRAWVRDAAAVLERGWIFVIDYGFFGGEPAQSVRGYTGQRVTDDVLGKPGSRDISTGVDFEVLAEEARAAGMEAWGPVSQRDALHALGYRAWLDALRRRQAEAEAAGDHRVALRLFAERSRAPMLVDPAQLGRLRVVAFGRGVRPPRLIKAG